MLCDKKVPIKLKDKVCKTVIKPTMTYGAECWAVRKKGENILHVAEMRMLRWIMGETRKDHVRNQIIQEDADVCQMSKRPQSCFLVPLYDILYLQSLPIFIMSHRVS